MERRIARILLIPGFIVFAAIWTPASPAEAAPDPCLGVDWGALGYRDGARGLENVFVERARECGAPPDASDAAEYDDGYATGLRLYCTPENARRVGALNLEYLGVCPLRLELGFLAAYRRGLANWAVAQGHSGYWLDGIVVLHYLLPSPRWPRTYPHKPPKPRRLHWRDRGGDWDATTRPSLDSIFDPAPRQKFKRTRDWTRLWEESPPPPPPSARIEPTPPRPTPPSDDRREDRRERDRGYDRDYDDDRDWSRDYSGPRARRDDRLKRKPGGAWRPNMRERLRDDRRLEEHDTEQEDRPAGRFRRR